MGKYQFPPSLPIPNTRLFLFADPAMYADHQNWLVELEKLLGVCTVGRLSPVLLWRVRKKQRRAAVHKVQFCILYMKEAGAHAQGKSHTQFGSLMMAELVLFCTGHPGSPCTVSQQGSWEKPHWTDGRAEEGGTMQVEIYTGTLPSPFSP